MLSVNKLWVKLQNYLNQILRWRVNEVKNFVRENVSDCSLCQVENERFGRNACFSQKAKPCQTQKLSQAVRTVKFKNLSKPITFQGATKRSLVCGRAGFRKEILSDTQESGQKVWFVRQVKLPPAIYNLLCAVYWTSIGLLIFVIISPIIGLNKIDQKTDFPYPISRFAPMCFAIKWVSTM